MENTKTTYVERRAWMVEPGMVIETTKYKPVSRVIVDAVTEQNSMTLKLSVKVPFVRDIYIGRNETVWQVI